MARRIADTLGYPASLVVDRKPTVGSGRAPRPRDVSLCNDKAKMILKTPMLNLDQGIEVILKNKRDMDL